MPYLYTLFASNTIPNAIYLPSIYHNSARVSRRPSLLRAFDQVLLELPGDFEGIGVQVVPVDEESQKNHHEDDLGVEESVGLGVVVGLNRKRST